MDFLRILTGKEKPLPVYPLLVPPLENPLVFPDLIEPIYREAMKMDDDDLDGFGFALLRLQIYADVHIRYVALVLERLIYGAAAMEPEEDLAAG